MGAYLALQTIEQATSGCHNIDMLENRKVHSI